MPHLARDLEAELASLELAGLRRSIPVSSAHGGASAVAGGRRFVNGSSNDYLGLAAHAEVVRAAIVSLETRGHGAGAARLLGGTFPEHEALERDLAAFKGTEAALLFSTGYHANVGTIAALVGPEDAVYSDAWNHASLIDGCRLSRASVFVYPHRDADALGRVLADGARFRRRLVVTDGVFGMDGDAAPLDEIAALARLHDAIVMVDEAHATGVRGPRGRGLAAEVGVTPEIAMGTLGKALGSFGAFVCGTRALCDYLANRARTFVFTTALPPSVAAAARAALAIASSDEGERLRARLRANAARLAAGLRALGLADPAPGAHIFPIIMGDATRALAASAALEARGVLAPAVRPPTVPDGTSRLRFAASAAHALEDIDFTLEALRHVLRR